MKLKNSVAMARKNSIILYGTGLILTLALWLAQDCEQPKKADLGPSHQKPFMGMEATPIPKMLAPELLASPAQEYNGTFSPNGKEFYFTLDVPEGAFIAFTEMDGDGNWTAPKVATFSGEHPDYDPLFSPDGNTLYFSSRRMGAHDQKSKIWYTQRTDGIWGEPQKVDLLGEETDEYYSSVTVDGDMYFNVWSKGKIYWAKKDGNSYGVQELDSIVNGISEVGDPFISPEGDYLIFRGYGDDSLGGADLYVSFFIDGHWSSPENLGPDINSEAFEVCPWVSLDGKFLVFASNRIQYKLEVGPSTAAERVIDKFKTHDNGDMNIYYVSADVIGKIKEKHEYGKNGRFTLQKN